MIFSTSSFCCPKSPPPSAKELDESDRNLGDLRAGEGCVAFDDPLIEISASRRAAIHFDPALDRNHDPVFPDARFGVERGLFAIEVFAADGDLYDQEISGGLGSL